MARAITFGSYDTATNLWTLADWSLTPVVVKVNYLEIPGSDRVLDLSTALTDGEPTFSPRTLTVRLESSEGDRDDRLEQVSDLTNSLAGRRLEIHLPDDSDRHLTGRIDMIEELYNDLAHAAVLISATCDPWRESDTQVTEILTASGTSQSCTLENEGQRGVLPTLTVAGGTVRLVYDGSSWDLTAGTYQLPDLYVKGGEDLTFTYTGSGTLTVTYREAIL